MHSTLSATIYSSHLLQCHQIFDEKERIQICRKMSLLFLPTNLRDEDARNRVTFDKAMTSISAKDKKFFANLNVFITDIEHGSIKFNDNRPEIWEIGKIRILSTQI